MKIPITKKRFIDALSRPDTEEEKQRHKRLLKLTEDNTIYNEVLEELKTEEKQKHILNAPKREK